MWLLWRIGWASVQDFKEDTWWTMRQFGMKMNPFLDSKASWWYSFPPADILFFLLILFPLVLSQLLIKTLQQFIVVGSSTASSSRQRCPQRENPFLSLVTNRFAGPTLAEGLPALQNQPTTSPAVNSAQLTAQSIPLSALLSHPCLSPWICPGA